MSRLWDIGLIDEEVEDLRALQVRKGLRYDQVEEAGIFRALANAQRSKCPGVDYFGSLIDAFERSERFEAMNKEDGPYWWIEILKAVGKKGSKAEGLRILARVLQILVSQSRLYVRRAIKGVETLLAKNFKTTIQFSPSRETCEKFKNNRLLKVRVEDSKLIMEI